MFNRRLSYCIIRAHKALSLGQLMIFSPIGQCVPTSCTDQVCMYYVRVRRSLTMQVCVHIHSRCYIVWLIMLISTFCCYELQILLTKHSFYFSAPIFFIIDTRARSFQCKGIPRDIFDNTKHALTLFQDYSPSLPFHPRHIHIYASIKLSSCCTSFAFPSSLLSLVSLLPARPLPLRSAADLW